MSLQMIQQLEVLRDRVLAMAELVEKALDGSVKILSHRDELEARRILDYEAAINGLEFELSQSKLASLLGIGLRLEKTLASTAEMAGDMMVWARTCEDFRRAMRASWLFRGRMLPAGFFRS